MIPLLVVTLIWHAGRACSLPFVLCCAILVHCRDWRWEESVIFHGWILSLICVVCGIYVIVMVLYPISWCWWGAIASVPFRLSSCHAECHAQQCPIVHLLYLSTMPVSSPLIPVIWHGTQLLQDRLLKSTFPVWWKQGSEWHSHWKSGQGYLYCFCECQIASPLYSHHQKHLVLAADGQGQYCWASNSGAPGGGHR